MPVQLLTAGRARLLFVAAGRCGLQVAVLIVLRPGEIHRLPSRHAPELVFHAAASVLWVLQEGSCRGPAMSRQRLQATPFLLWSNAP